MSLFIDIPKKISIWIGVPGLIMAFTLALAVWLYYDLVVDMTLNSSMIFGVGICSLLLVSLVKIVIGLFRHSTTAKDDAPDEE